MGGIPTLKLKDVEIARGGRTLIAGLNLNLESPQLLWIEGGNGIGKTSLLRTCAGLASPVSGRVLWSIDGQSCRADSCVAFLPADGYAKSGLTAGEDAAFWGASLKAVDMARHAETRTEKLSTGQAKRLSLAKLLAADKPIWILDEPLAGLDSAGRAALAAQLKQHIRCGGLALVASHAPIPITNIPIQRLSLG